MDTITLENESSSTARELLQIFDDPLFPNENNRNIAIAISFSVIALLLYLCVK